MSMGVPGTTVSAEAAVTVDPTTGKPPSAPAVSNDTPKADDQNPQWLASRLERERAKVLKDLGIDSLESGKQKLDALKAKEDSEKSAAQKAVELEASLKQTKASNDAMAASLATYAKGAMGTLTDAQRNAVIAVAGEDAGAQLRTIEALKPTWAVSAPAAAAAVAAPVIPVVADTAPPAGAPKDGAGAGAAPKPWDVYAELAKTNPVVAARYAEANGLL